MRYPRGFTRLRLDAAGQARVDDVIWNFELVGRRVELHSEAAGARSDDEMAAVPAGKFALYIPGLEHLPEEPTTAFAMDRHEVTNREYKRFVDAGGYTRPKYWRSRSSMAAAS